MKAKALFATVTLVLASLMMAPTASASFHGLCPGGSVGDACDEAHDVYIAAWVIIISVAGPLISAVVTICHNLVGTDCPL